MKKSRMVIKFDPYCALMINRSNHTRIVFHFHCCSKYKLSTICTDLACFVTLTFRFKTLFKFFVYLFLYIIYDWITIMGYSQHEFSMINMLYSLKKIIVSITPLLLPHNSYLSTTATFDYNYRVTTEQKRIE